VEDIDFDEGQVGQEIGECRQDGKHTGHWSEVAWVKAEGIVSGKEETPTLVRTARHGPVGRVV